MKRNPPKGTRGMRPDIHCTTTWTAHDAMMESTFDASHSRQSSGSTASDSSPVSPTFSLRGHTRYASSNSSSISLPTPHLPQSEYSSFYQKSMPALPDVVEDPMERDATAEPQGNTQYYGRHSETTPVLYCLLTIVSKTLDTLGMTMLMMTLSTISHHTLTTTFVTAFSATAN